MKDILEDQVYTGIRWEKGYEVKCNESWIQTLKDETTDWECRKCKGKMKRHALTELFVWGEYVCTPCIEAWLGEELYE